VGRTAPVRNVIEWFNRAHPHASVLLTQDNSIAGLTGDVYENNWHQWNILNAIRRAGSVSNLHRWFDQTGIRYLIARQPTAGNYARPLAMRQLLDQCTVAEYAFDEFYVARLEPLCRDAAPVPIEPLVTVGPGTYDDFDSRILLVGDWDRSDQFAEPLRHTVTFTDIPGAEIRFKFEGGDLTYLFTRAPNRGVASVSIDGVSKGAVDLYSADVQWQSRARFNYLGPGRHLLVIRVTGQSRPAAKGNFVDLDAFEVQ
jgi:hypothetical protein